MIETATKETLGFQAEVTQLLHLMVHSLYGNKEIFLRELVSNASDAGDKLRFEAMTDAALFENDPDPKIRVSYDAQARTITVSDNGIGMSRQEVIEHIGTIAKSGTREFFARLTPDRAKDAHLIGQFGVGFYSSFIVADRVTLITRRAGLTAEHGVRWESSGEGDYTVETVRKETRGTDVVLHLRPEEDDLLSGMRLREILRKYSDHITLPILMKKERGSEQTGPTKTSRSTRPRHCGRVRRRKSPRSSTTSSTSTWRTISSRRSPTRTPGSKAGRNSRSCSSSRSGRRSICGTASTGAASSSTSAGYSSWTMPSSCCRRICGSCAGSSTRATCR